jgi:hypothetical protein
MTNKYYLIIAVFIFALNACSPDKKTSKTATEDVFEVKLDSSNKVVKFENSLFSLPSPYQLSLLIKEIGTDYNSELLNPTDNYKQYTNLFKKSINLGVYGADLAYLNIYEQSPAAVTYFSIIKLMSEDLGLSSAFSPAIFKRIENNIDNKDSLLYIISNAYRNVDMFLKENQRQKEGALVLAGGWIEGMHLITKLALETNSGLLKDRIGENKQPLENLIKILSPYYNESDDIALMIDDLIDLSYEFDAVETVYTYKEPTTIPEKKLTHIHSLSGVKVSDEVLKTIETKIDKIRNLVTK